MITTTTKTVISSPEFVKPKFIILEGVDRTGKSTMQLAINKSTKYKHYVMDRGPIGFKAYCEIFNKDKELFESYDKSEKEFLNIDNVLVIYLDCDTSVLIDRCIKTGHETIDYPFHKKIYEKYYNESKLAKVKVDTTNTSVYEIAEELVKKGVI